jgi:hypothetical protein
MAGKRSWIRVQGRANAALFLAARALDAEFIEPANAQEFAGVRGRTRGCAFELRVTDTMLVLTARHFHAQTTRQLEGPGLEIPDLDPDAMTRAINETCASFAENQ